MFLNTAIQQVMVSLWIFYGNNGQLKSDMTASTFDPVTAYRGSGEEEPPAFLSQYYFFVT